jgi:hypothetical protein
MERWKPGRFGPRYTERGGPAGGPPCRLVSFTILPFPAAIPVPAQTDILSELQATLGNGFRVTRELAGGGMSRVFVAEEALLQREIVVKLLPPDLMAGLSVERFLA